jgi:hypothetical protein
MIQYTDTKSTRTSADGTRSSAEQFISRQKKGPFFSYEHYRIDPADNYENQTQIS